MKQYVEGKIGILDFLRLSEDETGETTVNFMNFTRDRLLNQASVKGLCSKPGCYTLKFIDEPYTLIEKQNAIETLVKKNNVDYQWAERKVEELKPYNIILEIEDCN